MNNITRKCFLYNRRAISRWKKISRKGQLCTVILSDTVRTSDVDLDPQNFINPDSGKKKNVDYLKFFLMKLRFFQNYEQYFST